MSSCAGAESTGAWVREASRIQSRPKTIVSAAPRMIAGDADDEPDENDGDADREADRPEALARCLRSVVGILGHSLLSIA